MKLTDFDKKTYATKALEENYNVGIDFSKLSKNKTQEMLQKIRSLAGTIKESDNYYQQTSSPEYMRLIFMEEALVEHYNKLLKQPKAKIVFENEAVEEAQVTLAAQDFCDTIQKMLEDIGQMQVKELPALVDSIESEVGANEANAYNEQVSNQLDTLSTTLKDTFAALKSARDALTGQVVAGSFDAGAEAGMDAGLDLGAEAGAEAGMDAGLEMGADAAMDMEPQTPEKPVSSVGREKR